jgi:hypothetical protein
MAPPQRTFSDLHVPLTPSSTATPSSASWTRKQLAHIYQTRLHQLGYSSLAFCHTTYGRVDAKKDDADAMLPWRDILLSNSLTKDERNTLEKYTKDDPSGGRFGRRNALGMTIYRRINIVLEEVGDVSRLFLPSQSTATSSSTDSSALSLDETLQKYDIVSLQPMNEPAFQNICEFLASPANDRSGTIPSNNVDILVLEYATGSRGGYGLPYKLRKDSLVKTMEAGVAFEVGYASAVMDTKRRQGYLRTLVEFQSCFNSVQKKHALLNGHVGERRRMDGEKCRSEAFPLLISSGSRQNYSLGTDEGVFALRSPRDVQFLAGYTMGGNAWVEKNEYLEETRDKKRRRFALSAAEKVLARARDRSFGVVLTFQSSTGDQKKRRRGVHSNSSIRAYVCAISTTSNGKKIKQDEDDDSDDSSVDNRSKNLLEWLSEPIKMKGECEPTETENNHDNTVKFNEVRTRDENTLQDEVIEKGLEDDDEDLEDGFLAL